MTWLDVIVVALDVIVVALGVAGYFAVAILASVVIGRVLRHRDQSVMEDVEARRQERDAEETLYPHASKRKR